MIPHKIPILFLLFLLILLISFPSMAKESETAKQSQTNSQISSDSLKSGAPITALIKKLEERISELEKINKKQKEQDELNKLLEEAKNLTTIQKKKEIGVGKKFSSGVRQQSGLNPNISVGGDFYTALSTAKDNFITKPGAFSYGNNRFQLRELELSFESPLDPFTRGKTHLSLTENSICIEEAYMEWLNLPANLNLKIGLFNAEFGNLNRYHDHALPQFDRPRVLVDMFTNCTIGGFGVGGNFLLKPLLFADASTLDLTVLRGGNGQSFTDEGKYNLLYSGVFKNYYDITQNTYLEWRLSGVSGKNDPTEKYWSHVGNFAFTVKWVPINRSKYRAINWQTEMLYNYRETPTGTIKSKGFYTSLQNKLNMRYWTSVRVGYSELPFDTSQHEWDFTGCVDFWQSEFVFLRLQYQYNKRDISSLPDLSGPFPSDQTLILQVNWAMGPHKHEAY